MVTTSTVLETRIAVQTSTVLETSTVVETSVTIQVSTIVADRPDPDTAGEQDGPPCPVDGNYHDEDPAGLDPRVVQAWSQAQSDAAAAGIVLCLNDGKRSVRQQQQTYADYVEQYGQDVANTLVLPPEKSAHVAGYAIDVQPATAASWLEQTNGSYGLCRVYDNEAWHFEYAGTFYLGCPPRRAQPGG